MGSIMKKLLLFFLCVFFFAGQSLADELTTVIEVEGFGVSQNEAVQNGLIQAVKQTKGVSIRAREVLVKNIREKNISENTNNTHHVEIDALSSNSIKEATKGLVNEYRIINTDEVSPGEWKVTLEVKMSRYKTPGISPDSRRRIAVIPFRCTKSFYNVGGSISCHEISRQFTQKLVTEITQSRKFTVLDREYIEEFLHERNIVLSADAPISEQMKAGEVLGVDYLLIGTISEAGIRRTPYRIQISGESGYDYSASFVADYRIIVMATRQIKWADSVTLSPGDEAIRRMAPGLHSDQIRQGLLNRASKLIIDKALANIYPLRVAQVEPDGQIILNQGGKTVSRGDVFNVFTEGNKVFDPYTRESLGSSESWIATVRVSRVIAKMSFAKVIKGSFELIKIGNICRRITNKKKSYSRRLPGKASSVKLDPNGGVVLPYD